MNKEEILIALGADDIEENDGTFSFALENCPMDIESDEIYDGMTSDELENKSVWYSYCCDVTLDKDTPICPKCGEWAK